MLSFPPAVGRGFDVNPSPSDEAPEAPKRAPGWFISQSFQAWAKISLSMRCFYGIKRGARSHHSNQMGTETVWEMLLEETGVQGFVLKRGTRTSAFVCVIEMDRWHLVRGSGAQKRVQKLAERAMPRSVSRGFSWLCGLCCCPTCEAESKARS